MTEGSAADQRGLVLLSVNNQGLAALTFRAVFPLWFWLVGRGHGV